MSGRRAAHVRRQASVDYPRYPPQNSSTQQPPQMLQAPPVSDCESDNPGYISDIPLKLPPPTRTIEEVNISVLRRHNSEIAQIMSIVSYAVIYEFSPIPEPTWSKTGVEGSMFICQMTPGLYNEDRYNVVVLNRRGLLNFDVELREAEESGVEVSDPYVIISCKEDHEQKIYGVFIFSEGIGTVTEQQRVDNANLMKTLAISAGTSRKAAEIAASNAVAQHHDGHIQEALASLNDVPNENRPDENRQTELLDLFSMHSNENPNTDASFQPALSTNHTHSQIPLHQHQQSPFCPGQQVQQPEQSQQPQQPDVLGDLFRRAGLK